MLSAVCHIVVISDGKLRKEWIVQEEK